MIIRNAEWLNSEGDFVKSDIQIEQGKISGFNPAANSSPGNKIFDAAGMLVLPGAIDPHVHFREPGQVYKEGIASGSKAALKGGVTTILDMPNNKPPCSTKGRLNKKKELFRKKSHVNWGIMYHTTRYNRDNVADQIASAKIYMAKSSALPAITSIDDLRFLFRRFPKVSIHAEDETEFDTSSDRSPLHHENRPRKAITGALFKIETALKSLKKDERPGIVICHMNTADEVDWIKRMKSEGFNVWGETCPHYLYFTQDDYIKKGTAFQVNPPIRTKADQERLKQGLKENIIDFIGTDHAPHLVSEKQSGKPPSGIAAIEWLIPQILNFVDSGLLTWKQYHRLICGAASECYSIKGRNGIKKGNFADLVFVRKMNGKTERDNVQTKTGVNLYESFNFKWQVAATMVNGILKYDGKQFFPEGKGKEVLY